MDYSPYLEYCDGGKNAVLYPTINKMQTEILEGMRGIVK